MTPKEKARELRDKMWLKIPSVYDPTGLPHYPIAKEMALIAVEESLEWTDNLGIIKFLNEVKNELEKL